MLSHVRFGLPFPPPGDLPDPAIESGSSALQEDSLPTELQGKPAPPSTPKTLKTECILQKFIYGSLMLRMMVLEVGPLRGD